jgi:enoyl-CoA hydratase/carnithine racemase
MSEVVRVEKDGHVAVVTLNRPDKLNAVSTEVFTGLHEAGKQVEADPEVRAVVLRGEGRAFCSGLDLQSIGAIGSGGATQGNGDTPVVTRDPQGGFRIWATMAKPVVAAVQGYALGAGLQLALAADIRVAAEGAVWSVFEVTYGLVPDLGGTQILPQLVGPSRAKELIWTARRFSSEEAEAWGIVNKVVSADALQDEAMAVARDLASRPPLPIAFSKELVALSGRVPLEEGMRREIEAQMKCIASNDCKEAVAAAFEKREGSFTGT